MVMTITEPVQNPRKILASSFKFMIKTSFKRTNPDNNFEKERFMPCLTLKTPNSLTEAT